MPRQSRYFVYILSNKSRTLYVGVTNNLPARVLQHREQKVAGFTRRYQVTQLAYFEETNDVREAIAREKQIKGWLRARKLVLIESVNPHWRDLAEDFLGPYRPDPSLRSG